MEKTECFKEYQFTKMDPEDSGIKSTADQLGSMGPTGLKKIFIQNKLLILTLVGVLAGIAFGFGLRPYQLGGDTLMLISYPGELFMRVLNLVILPLIIASLIASSSSIDKKMSGKIVVRTLLYFVLNSMFNALLGIFLAVLIHPGQPKLENNGEEHKGNDDYNILDNLLDIGRNIIPDNIVRATFQRVYTVYEKPSNTFDSHGSKNQSVSHLVRGLSYRSGTNTLGLVFFCMFFGSLLGTIGRKGQVVVDFFQAIFEVIMKMVKVIMWFSPIGISSVIAGKILSVEDVAQVMHQLGWFIFTVTIGIYFYQLVVMQLIYFLFLKKNPYKYYWGLMQPMLTAAAMSSTAAALPVTFRAIEGPLGIDPRITRFVLPIGCIANLNGTALFMGAASVFLCQMNNIQLGFSQLAIIFLTVTACSLSTGPVPSASIVLLIMVLGAIDAPTQDISLLLAVDWLLDRMRTTNNMLSGCYAAAVVEHLSLKELNACNEAAAEAEHRLSGSETGVDTKTSAVTSIPSDIIIDVHIRNNSYNNIDNV